MPGIRAADVAIRPLRLEDAAAAGAAARTSLNDLYPEDELAPGEEAIRVAGATAREALATAACRARYPGTAATIACS